MRAKSNFRPGRTRLLPAGAARLIALPLLLVTLGGLRAAEPAKLVPPDHAAKMQEALELFRRHVGPALTNHCIECHSGATPKASLDLTARESLEGSGMLGDSAEESLLYLNVAHLEEPFMPHKRPKLPDETIASIARWIDLGAPYDRPLVEAPAGATEQAPITEAERNFWSFQPLADDKPPSVEEDRWAHTPIDAFILRKLREENVAPNPEADRRTLLRRLYLDLIGLPPTPEKVEQFLAGGEGAYERLVDELLDSPHFGERWARHWLDVVRFAESDGFEHDSDRPHAYHYRDFVIRAFNDDLPFDTFVRWQIAGDEFAPDNPLAWMATGFLTAGVFPTQITEAEFERTRYDQLDDMTSTTGVAFLGLTVGCARCHDHKYDPVRSEDYYRLLATFGKTIRSDIELNLSPLGKEHSAGPVTVQVGSEGLPPVKNHADERGYPHVYPETFILERGDPEQKRAVAIQSFLPVLMRNDREAHYWQESPSTETRQSFRRRSLGNWLTDAEQGAGHLVARVIVNRLWQHYLGRGIVATPNDFGMQGERPSHPELLDWLARQLIQNGWRLKPIHRLIVTSGVYQQSSANNPAGAQADPENRLYWRFQPRRPEAEAVRDSLLACGGQLDLTMYGPGSLDESMRRRSIYFTVKRSQMISSMQLLDAPEPLVSIGARSSTTTAPQALWFMNSPLVRGAAQGLAARLEPAAERSLSEAIEAAYLIALARRPTSEETELWLNVIDADIADYQARGEGNARGLALANFCQMLLSTNEFVYVQ